MRAGLTTLNFMAPPVSALPEEARLRLKAARMWIMLARHQRNPRPVLISLLAGHTGAFCTLMETVVTAWPDAFTAYPPCAAQVSPDEATLLDLLAEAADGDEAAAQRLLEEMLPVTDRGRLWQAAVRAVPAPLYPW
ncbi:hypothetical protein L6Q21_17660 [Sandaracinobacter sp. RS1-74]|uniref:hypothetical protein n=1 Tax=Sandaracinobacteroides sayramensis TaxID=2913411 RepID=UPI001EDA4A23|nr:hypothetical protein [Sandaracinobacteroides sayramensis]MCG2842807.1 hypothetical protein [Sandaracinobacteroides sayramensis]